MPNGHGPDANISPPSTSKSEFFYLNRFASIEALQAGIGRCVHDCNHNRTKLELSDRLTWPPPDVSPKCINGVAFASLSPHIGKDGSYLQLQIPHGRRVMDLNDEKQLLAKADIDIDQARARILRQGDIVDELQRDGHDTAAARDLLATLQATLNAMIEHRRLIVEHIERLERKGRGPSSSS